MTAPCRRREDLAPEVYWSENRRYRSGGSLLEVVSIDLPLIMEVSEGMYVGPTENWLLYGNVPMAI